MEKKDKWIKITIIWLVLLDSLITQKLISDYYTLRSFNTNEFVTGNIVAHNLSTMNVLNEAFLPLLIYNLIIALLLSMNYHREKIKNLFK